MIPALIPKDILIFACALLVYCRIYHVIQVSSTSVNVEVVSTNKAQLNDIKLLANMFK